MRGGGVLAPASPVRRWGSLALLAVVMAGCTSGPAVQTGHTELSGERATGAAVAAQPGESQPVPADWVPALDQVATLHLHLGMPVPGEQTPQPLYATHPQHRATIAVLLDLLAQTRLAPGEISMPARSPSLQVALQGGGSLSVRLAYNCTPFSSEDGHGYTCRQAPGELILQTRQGQVVRVANPPLARWLLGEWRADLPVGAIPDIEREMALSMARRADPRASWKATFFAEYPVEGKGGTEVRRAWIIEAEYPSGSKTRMVIDAQSGEIIRFGQLEALE